MKIRNILLLVVALAAMNTSSATEQSIILASTTSVEATGLLADILPRFKAKTGIKAGLRRNLRRFLGTGCRFAGSSMASTT